jgi:hypothetical protein
MVDVRINFWSPTVPYQGFTVHVTDGKASRVIDNEKKVK